VCFFGTYARDYTVTRLLAQACAAAGIEVIECHRPLWETARYKPAAYFGPRSMARLLGQYVRQAVALARARRASGRVPVYLIGFNGQVDCLLLRFLVRRDRTPIVFAPLVTLTETLTDDRAVFRAHSAKAGLARWIDRFSLKAATQVVIDTDAHRRYLVETFGISPERVSTWHLGADPTVFSPRARVPREGPMRVLFYGSFLPLHGVRAVLEAASILRDDHRVEFVLVGDGPEREACAARVQQAQLRRVRFADWVPYPTLGEMVAEADVCLGIFGSSGKVQMVIPNKVYQAAAVGRPVITADTPAVREVFVHGENAWLCPLGDPAALAEAIRGLCDDLSMRQRLGCNAAAMMTEMFSPAAQGRRLGEIFERALGHV